MKQDRFLRLIANVEEVGSDRDALLVEAMAGGAAHPCGTRAIFTANDARDMPSCSFALERCFALVAILAARMAEDGDHALKGGEPLSLAGGGGSLRVVTTNLRAGYLRKNGVPYSEQTTVTEYFDIASFPDGSKVLLVTTTVEDPVYLNGPYVVSPHFKKEADGSKWDPMPCSSTW